MKYYVRRNVRGEKCSFQVVKDFVEDDLPTTKVIGRINDEEEAKEFQAFCSGVSNDEACDGGGE